MTSLLFQGSEKMIDPSSSEEDSDDDQRVPPVPQAHHHPRGGQLHPEPQRESLDVPNKAGSHRSLSPNSTASSDTLNVGHGGPGGGMGAGPGASNIGAGSALRGASAFQRPTSPSPSLVSEKTVTDSIDPQVRRKIG